MNIIDIGVIFLILFSGVMGWKKGIIKEAVTIIGMIAILIIAYMLKEEIGNFLCKYIPFFPFAGKLRGLVSLNILIFQAIGFFLIYSILFGVYTIILKASKLLQKLVNATIILAIPSKIGGFILGAVEGYIFSFIVLLILMFPFKNLSMFEESKSLQIMIYKTPIISSYVDNAVKTLNDTYELVDNLSKENISINDANLDIIDTMLKYKMVSKKTVEQLIVLDKLDDVKGIDQILKNY